MLFPEARAPPTGRRAQGTGREEVAQAGKGRAAGSQMVQEMPRVTVLPPEARETREGVCLPIAPWEPSWKQLLSGEAAGTEIWEDWGETQGREKDATKMRRQCKAQGWERSFFFSFLLGLFVLETLVTSNSKVILKTY